MFGRLDVLNTFCTWIFSIHNGFMKPCDKLRRIHRVLDGWSVQFLLRKGKHTFSVESHLFDPRIASMYFLTLCALLPIFSIVFCFSFHISDDFSWFPLWHFPFLTLSSLCAMRFLFPLYTALSTWTLSGSIKNPYSESLTICISVLLAPLNFQLHIK